MAETSTQPPLIGQSGVLLALLDKVSKLAPIERPVLIIGERGTGKELIARRLHYLSRRWDKPLVSLNCAALSDSLIDSELFGHESGAFTGAKTRHRGRFERAENGTLFLDELATMPPLVQQKLLRVIEYGEYERVGGHAALKANVRVLAATNAELPQLVSEGKFRADLLDRLAFDVLLVPPLRQRQTDILLLAEHYAIKMCRELARPYFVGFSASARQALLNYSWPGNVRELKNVIERAVCLTEDENQPIEAFTFNPWPADRIATETAPKSATVSLPVNYRQWQENNDKELLIQALNQSHYNQGEAAKLLSLSYHQFRGMIRKYGIVTSRTRKE